MLRAALFRVAAALGIAAVAIASPAGARAATFGDYLVQPPSLAAPERGSVAGALAHLGFEAGSLSRGDFSLPIPIGLPGERGVTLVNVLPSYSPDSGQSEWGMGWRSDLSIRRFAVIGDINMAGNEFVSPWGRLTQDSAGRYVPIGSAPHVALRQIAGGWEATTGDGAKYIFAATDVVVGGYAWMLTRVEGVLGDTTTLSYTRNASGRPFLASVEWGGRGDAHQYRLQLAYEAIAIPLQDYRSGSMLALDQRVREAKVLVRASTGSFEPRWTYRLDYTPSPRGAAFYLTGVTKTYGSGASEPTQRYTYDFGESTIANATLVDVPELTPILLAKGSSALQPDKSTATDTDADGQGEFEIASDMSIVRRVGSSFVNEPLPEDPNSTAWCRPEDASYNTPRMLARMTGDASEVKVVRAALINGASQTRMLVCNRQGVAEMDETIAGAWAVGPTVHLVDLNHDHRPDFVRLYSKGFQVLENTSDETGYHFVAHTPGKLNDTFISSSSWVHDMNGDGQPDMVMRFSSSVLVWHGLGNFQFAPAGRSFTFKTISGSTVVDLDQRQLTFVDVNHDGLMDVLTTRGRTLAMFVNDGKQFKEMPIPALTSLGWDFGVPVVADVTGQGNTELLLVQGALAKTLDLTSPSTGLMTSADDGKGTVARFGYARSAPAAGAEQRITVLDSLTLESSGYDTVAYHYNYGAPVTHGLGKYLVGFTSAEKRSPMLAQHVDFLNDDDVSGVVQRSEDTDDRTPNVVRFTRSDFEDIQLNGVRWLRPSSTTSGHRSTDRSIEVATSTVYATYERGFCPTVSISNTPSGVLVTSMVLARVAGIPDELHCLPSSTRLAGQHANPALDFVYLAKLQRNDAGQVTNATQFGPGMQPLGLQDIDYDSDHRVRGLSAPGKGTTTLTYDEFGRLASVTDPVGVVTAVDEMDPTTDALRALSTLRPSASTTATFRYDERERLSRSWDDATGSSESLPLAIYSYQDATATTPGRIQSQALIDEATDAMRTTVDLVGADGESLLSGAWLGDHLAAGATSIAFRNTLTKRSSVVGALSAAQLSAMTSADLRGLGTPIAEDVAAGFGHSIQTTTQQQAGVVGTVTSEVVLGAAGLITRTHQPGGFTAESELDAAGHLRRHTDENGVSHWYSYDALGRLVAVDTPDGLQSLAFDGFARPQQVTRAGLGAIRYSYDPVTGLLANAQHLDANGVVVNTAATSYDAVGRPALLAQSTSTESSNLVLEYDGQIDTAIVDGQLGRQSHIRGEGWDRTTLFDALGRAYQQRVRLDGWRDITTDTLYRSDGAFMFDTVTIADASGNTQLSVMHETVPDEYGRPATVWVNSLLLYTLSYDAESRLARADFTSGESITFDYDPVTHARTGYTVTAPNATGGVHWNRDPRGLVADELYANGTTSSRRDYGYDGRGALTSSVAGAELASYSYTASGLPETITDLAGTRSVHRTSSQLTVGDTSYTWDAAGRVVAKGEWTMTYGPDGQLRHASRPGRELDFVYDDGHARLLKRVDGAPVRANVAGGVLTEDHFIELVTVGGVVAGILDNGEFTALLTDPRGTPFAAADGTPNMATPYGVRASHLGFSEAIDYTRLGWDADLDVVRMGVRDYDAKLSQFWTPDPLYFADLEKCQSSALQCALYGYATGNPVSFVDPRGTDVDGLMHGSSPDYGAVSLEIAHTATNAVYETICAFVGCGTAGGGGDTWQKNSDGSRREVNGHFVADYNHPTHRVSYKEQAIRVATIVGLGKLANIVVPKAVRTLIGDEASALLNNGERRVPAIGELSESELSQAAGAASRPPNLSPEGAGRRGAFNEAKRRSGVPVSQQPSRVGRNLGNNGARQPGRSYEFEVPAEGGGQRTVRIRDDAGGHFYGENDPQNRGPHFNDEAGNHYDY